MAKHSSFESLIALETCQNFFLIAGIAADSSLYGPDAVKQLFASELQWPEQASPAGKLPGEEDALRRSLAILAQLQDPTK